MNPNTPAAISAPKIIKRHAKNCREEKSLIISDTLFSLFQHKDSLSLLVSLLQPAQYCMYYFYLKSHYIHIHTYTYTQTRLRCRLKVIPTDARRHWDSRTAPKQPKKPTTIISAPAPRRMYTAGGQKDGHISQFHFFLSINEKYIWYIKQRTNIATSCYLK